MSPTSLTSFELISSLILWGFCFIILAGFLLLFLRIAIAVSLNYLNSFKKDINSKEVIAKAFQDNPDDDAIDFIWALNLPSVQGSGFDSLDELRNSVELRINSVKNAAIEGVNSRAGTNISKSEEPQNIAGLIKSGGGEGKAEFKKLISSKKLNNGSKSKIEAEIKEAMTGIGT